MHPPGAAAYARHHTEVGHLFIAAAADDDDDDDDDDSGGNGAGDGKV